VVAGGDGLDADGGVVVVVVMTMITMAAALLSFRRWVTQSLK